MAEQDTERRKCLENACDNSEKLLFLPDPKSIGAGKFTLESEHVIELKKLHKEIVSGVGGVTWGEGDGNVDPRRRKYGFMPGKRQELIESGIRIEKEGADPKDMEHEKTLETACLNLAFSSDENRVANVESTTIGVRDSGYRALTAVTNKIQELVPEKYKKHVTMDTLVALQPNLHNGANYLPKHLDFPLADGFGIVIATVAVRGSGTIVLIDDGDEGTDETRSWSFELDQGECYILSGDARNKCLHGVLCNDNSNDRETLNLRYGLHSKAFAFEEVLQHWPEEA